MSREVRKEIHAQPGSVLSILISIRLPAALAPHELGLFDPVAPSGIASIFAASAKTKSGRAASSSLLRPLT